MGSLEDRVALVTGAGRGQGRSHAVRLAEEGAHVVAVDRCRDYDTVPYAMASPEDLEETVSLVEKVGRSAVAVTADVRELAALRAAVADTMERFGRLDVVVANAGITSWIGDRDDDQARQVWDDVLSVDLTGTWNTLRATTGPMTLAGNGGSIVLISSTAGLKGFGGGAAGLDAYCAAKHGVIGLTKSYALLLAPQHIRVNAVHPTAVETPMVTNDAFQKLIQSFGPDMASIYQNAMPIGLLPPRDVSEAVAWLASDAARYVTGISLPVDAGFLVR